MGTNQTWARVASSEPDGDGWMDIEHHIITLTNTHRRTVKMPVTSLQETAEGSRIPAHI
jgi:hypothetical protein